MHSALFVLAFVSLCFIFLWFVFPISSKDKKPVNVVVSDNYCPTCLYCTCVESPVIDLTIARPCGTSNEHFEDYINCLDEVLDEGKVYTTIACDQGTECTEKKEVFWTAWIRSYSNDICCGIDELVAFRTQPPKHFVFEKNHKIIEVICNEQRSSS
jgi:hypothetical protein